MFEKYNYTMTAYIPKHIHLSRFEYCFLCMNGLLVCFIGSVLFYKMSWKLRSKPGDIKTGLATQNQTGDDLLCVIFVDIYLFVILI